jgi:hypothetical protein
MTIIPKMTRPAPRAAVVVRQPAALRVKNIVGIVKIPQIAGNMRMVTYGTPGSR